MKQYFSPLFLENNPILPLDAKPEGFKVWFADGMKKKAYLVPTTKDVAKESIKDSEREKKRRQRRVKKGAIGKDWESVPFGLFDDEIESEEASIQMELVHLRVLFEQLVSIIEKKKPAYGQILRLTVEGKNQYEIARILGKAQPTIFKQKQSAIELLQKLYREET